MYVILPNSELNVQKKKGKTEGYGKIFSITEGMVLCMDSLNVLLSKVQKKSLFQPFCFLQIVIPGGTAESHNTLSD